MDWQKDYPKEIGFYASDISHHIFSAGVRKTQQ
jgi:hypothetical protein